MKFLVNDLVIVNNPKLLSFGKNGTVSMTIGDTGVYLEGDSTPYLARELKLVNRPKKGLMKRILSFNRRAARAQRIRRRLEREEEP